MVGACSQFWTGPQVKWRGTTVGPVWKNGYAYLPLRVTTTLQVVVNPREIDRGSVPPPPEVVGDSCLTGVGILPAKLWGFCPAVVVMCFSLSMFFFWVGEVVRGEWGWMKICQDPCSIEIARWQLPGLEIWSRINKYPDPRTSHAAHTWTRRLTRPRPSASSTYFSRWTAVWRSCGVMRTKRTAGVLAGEKCLCWNM